MKILFIASVTALVFILGSCSFIYIPSAPVVFNHENEGDLSVDLRQGGFSTNLNVGYAIKDNINIGTSISSLYTGDASVNGRTYEGTQAYDLGLIAGYFTKPSENTIFELNASAGSIFLNNDAIRNYAKVYLQPSIGFQSKNKSTVFNMGFRALGTSATSDFMQRDTLYYAGYFEPFLSLSAGKKVHFLMQAGVSVPLVENTLGDVSPFLLNFGIGYSIGTKKKPELIEKM